MSRRILILSIVLAIFISLALFAGLVFTNTVFIRNQPAEKNFLVPWLAARTFLQYGDNPYGDPASQRAQIVYYGKLVSPGMDPLSLWLPLPIELFFFPFALITDYSIACALWLSLLEISLIVGGFLALKLSGWKLPSSLIPIIILFPLVWIYGMFSLSNASGISFIILSIMGFIISIRDGKDEFAGALFFILFFAPRITGILIFFLVWWIIANKRWRIFAGFAMALFLMLLISFFLLPNWLPLYIQSAISHIAYTSSISSWKIFSSWSPVAGLRFGWVLTLGFLLVLFIEWGRTIRRDFKQLLWTISLTLAVVPLLGVPISIMDIGVLFIAMIYLLATLNERLTSGKKWGPTSYILIIVIILSWVIPLLLMVSGSQKTLLDFLVLFPSLVLLPGLYWVRWWVSHPSHDKINPFS